MTGAEGLVGRTEELGSFELLLERLDEGRPAALELVGEPGIGKTRLLAELAARAEDRGCLVLTGSGSELENHLPYWVFVDALDEYVQGLPPGSLETIDDEERLRLAQVFPSLKGSAARDETISPQERYRVHRSVRDLLAGLSRTQPLVLVLDDLHWADPASTDLVGALLHQPPVGPVLIAMGARPRAAVDRLSAALERGLRDGVLVRFELDALTLAEAQELLGDHAGAATAKALHEEGGGNPFYIEQLARSLARPAVREDGRRLIAALDVPRPVAEALATELAGLPDDARIVLDGAAVAGDPFEPELAAAIAGTSSDEALEALDELLRLDLVRPTEVPRRFRFRHPLVRRAVYESTGAGWRLTAHERAAEALAQQGASVQARAHHIERYARAGDVGAAALLRAAGEGAVYRAPESAALWLDVALRLLPDNASVTERVELLLSRSSALTAIGRFAESREALVDALDLLPKDALALRVRLNAACAAAERMLVRNDEAHARLTGALAEIADWQSPEATALMIELALDCRHRTDYDGMTRWSAEALRTARTLSHEPLTAVAVALCATASGFAGATADGLKLLREAVELVDGMPDSALASQLDAISHLATAELYLDRFRQSCAHSERAIAVAYATGQIARIPYFSGTLGSARVLLGLLAEGADVLDDAIEATRLSRDQQGLAWNLYNRSTAALASGDLAMALELARESVELMRRYGPSLIAVRAAVVWAAALVENGEPERAIEELVDSPESKVVASLPGDWRTKRLEVLARSYLAVDRADDAVRAAAAAQACAVEFGLPLSRATAHRAAAALALHEGAFEVAAERAQASAAIAEEVGAPIEAALSRILAGRALAHAGGTDAAAEELERAIASLRARGAKRYADEATRELRKLGRYIHRRTRSGVADGSGLESLTERELELARLVVDRKTNPQIAQELFLSQKTVETHLRNIFRKVGVANRVELARAVEAAERSETLT